MEQPGEGDLRDGGVAAAGDLYQIHGFDSVTPFEETLGALTDLVRHGKVRYIGCSNLAAWHIMKALGISALHHLERSSHCRRIIRSPAASSIAAAKFKRAKRQRA